MYNYKKLQFKAGLEIHQQIDGKKLFCNCPCIIKDEKPDFIITRKLNLSTSELGEIDPAALHEFKKGKEIIYEGYKDVNCLIEIDEEPPQEINEHALKIALQVALLVHAKPIEYMQFMRKIVIDGSNVSGFQRTALIATNGYIETSRGKVQIPSICLEEESAKKIEDKETQRKYNISRLGIPLIEISTDASLQDPEQVKEAAAKIGMILRSVEGIKRGIGSIRQDVNVSIKNGSRVEIKGFQDYRNIPKVIEYEINRQLEIVQQGKKVESEVRSARPDFTTRFERPMPGAARMYIETDIPLKRITKQELKKIEIPQLVEDKVTRLEETFAIDGMLAKELVKENLEEFFRKACLHAPDLKPGFIADLIISMPKEMEKKHNIKVKHDDFFIGVLESLSEKRIAKESLEEIFKEHAEKGRVNLAKYAMQQPSDMEDEIKKIIEENKGASFNAIMGEVMKRFKGKIDGKQAAELIKKHL